MLRLGGKDKRRYEISILTWPRFGVNRGDDPRSLPCYPGGSEQIKELREERTRPNIHAHFPTNIIASQSDSI